MLSFLAASSKPFEVLNGSTASIARQEIETKFYEYLGKHEVHKRCHEEIALALKEGLETGAEPRLLASLAKTTDSFAVVEFGASPVSEELHFVQVGKSVFPIIAADAGWGKKSLTLLEPKPASKFNEAAVYTAGLAGFYGPGYSADAIILYREKGSTTHVAFNGGKVHWDLPYAWALWESATSSIRRAHAAEIRADAMAKAKSASSKILGGSSGAPRTILEALPFLTKGHGVAEASGPPLGHDLIDALTWNGKAIAITSDRRGDRPVSVFIQEKVGGKLTWVELPWPKDKAGVPCRGASAVITGDRLRLFGGFDEKGVSIDRQWTYDLWQGQKQGNSPDLWENATPLSEGLANAIVAATNKETLIVGGVAGFYSKGTGKKVLLKQRGMVAESKSSWGNPWLKRAAAPNDITGSSVVVSNDAVIIGPGAERDGKLFVYDTLAGGEWSKLPELPKKLGLGQLHLNGTSLIYTGGFDADGHPSKAIYELDLGQIDASWKKLGDSDYVAGRARLVESHGRLLSLMVSPKGRITFHPGLGSSEAGTA